MRLILERIETPSNLEEQIINNTYRQLWKPIPLGLVQQPEQSQELQQFLFPETSLQSNLMNLQTSQQIEEYL